MFLIVQLFSTLFFLGVGYFLSKKYPSIFKKPESIKTVYTLFRFMFGMIDNTQLTTDLPHNNPYRIREIPNHIGEQNILHDEDPSPFSKNTLLSNSLNNN